MLSALSDHHHYKFYKVTETLISDLVSVYCLGSCLGSCVPHSRFPHSFMLASCLVSRQRSRPRWLGAKTWMRKWRTHTHIQTPAYQWCITFVLFGCLHHFWSSLFLTSVSEGQGKCICVYFTSPLLLLDHPEFNKWLCFIQGVTLTGLPCPRTPHTSLTSHPAPLLCSWSMARSTYLVSLSSLFLSHWLRHK